MASFPASSILVAVLALGVIVVIHELGHLLAAKLFRIRVEIFSVGFGPRLLGFRRGDTDYRISAFPLGGYVKIAGETITGAPEEFFSKPKWQRFLVAAAGPAMNVVLAVALLTGLFMYGIKVPAFTEGDAVVGTVERGSAADKAGIQADDLIVTIDGKERPSWQQVEARIVTNAGRNVALVLNRRGKTIETAVTPVKTGASQTGYAGMHPRLEETSVIERVASRSPAETAGLQPGDEITSVNGVEIRSRSGREVRDSLLSVPEIQEVFPLTFVRNGELHEIQLNRILRDGQRIVGIESFVTPTILIRESFVYALRRSINQNIESSVLIVQVLGRLLTLQAPFQSVEGPIGIMRVAGRYYEAGLAPLLMLMAMISLNLGLMNLLPIPILDGGAMMLLFVEGLMGRDLSIAVKERIVQFSLVLLLTLMEFVLYNDVVKLLPTKG